MISRLSFLPGLVALLGVCALTFFFFKRDQRIAYVDSVRLINSYQGMIDARKAYQGKVLSWKSNIDTLSIEIQRLIARNEKGSASWTVREKDLSQKLIETKRQQLADYQRAVNDMAGQEDATATKKIVNEINAYIRKYSETHDYTLVLAATEYGNVVYAKDYLDITESVLVGLNSSYGKFPR